jgi:hypothetical protein
LLGIQYATQQNIQRNYDDELVHWRLFGMNKMTSPQTHYKEAKFIY